MSSRKVFVLLVENGCKEHVLDDELCKAATQYTSQTTKKKSKNKSSQEANTEIPALYTENMIIITRKDIELNARAEDFEMKSCLEDYHMDSLNDYIEDKLDDGSKDDTKPVYVVLYGICDNIDDIKKLKQKNFEIRSFVYISDKKQEESIENKTDEQTEEQQASDKEQNANEEEAKQKEEEAEQKEEEEVQEKKISISEKIASHFMTDANYEIYPCLENIVLHKINSWKVVTKKNGSNDIRYKDVNEICEELRIYIQQMQSEWNLYDSNWRNESPINTTEDHDAAPISNKIPVINIPEAECKDINDYKIYNKYMNVIKSPNVSSVIQAMLQQIANDEDTTTDTKEIMDVDEEEEGIYRYGDILSQRNYLNQISKTQIEANQHLFAQCSKHVLDSLFTAYPAIDANVFESQNTARYTFSKLNPSIFDDALIYNELNQWFGTTVNDRIFREDLNNAQLIQRLQPFLSKPYMKHNDKYLSWCDAMLVTCAIDVSSESKQSNHSVFLSSKIGFRKWLKLPQNLKDISPNAFYSPSSPSQFLYHNSITIHPPFYNNWFMGLSAFDSESNQLNNKPYLWLRDDEDSVISISDYLSVHFPDNAQLSFQSKTAPIVAIEVEQNEATDAVEEETSEEKKETLLTPQSKDEDTIYVSLPNEITVEYHIKSGLLIIYYQSALKQYQAQQQNTTPETDPPSNDDTNETTKVTEDKTAESAANPEDINPDETETAIELEAVDVSWNNDNSIFVAWRVIDSNGVLTIFYSDDSERKIFPNSETWCRSSVDCAWIKVKSNGECMEGTQIKKAIHIATTTDSDTNTKIVTREDNVLVFCHANGDGFVQYPDSTHIFVKSNISKNEWDLHELSQWMQTMGVTAQSAIEISNVSRNTIDESADKLKNDMTEIRFELKNDCKMPTIIVDKENNNTKVLFYNGFHASFGHPNGSENVESFVNHVSTGKVVIYNKKDIQFIPKTDSASPDIYKINLNDENPSLSIKEYTVAMNGEYNAPANSDKAVNNATDSRIFVVYRDGNGYELLSNDTVCTFREYLAKDEPNTQILEPKALLSTVKNSPISHRFIMERYASNAPRTTINIPSVLRDTLQTKVNKYQDDEVSRCCHIYRHLLETPSITPQDIETAVRDMCTFEEWLNTEANRDKLMNSNEINEITDEIMEQRNKLKAETDLNPLELRLTLTAEIKREKLNALNEELLRKKELEEENANKAETEEEIEARKNKESEAKAREIRNIQQQNEERVSSNIQKENVSYFENEAFLRDYEINQHLLEIFREFIDLWTKPKYDYKRYNEQTEATFISILSSLKILCQRLTEICSSKTLDASLKTLCINEEIMENIANNEYITHHIHDILCCVGFAASANDDTKYIPEQSNIFIDAKICGILSKLDEFHSKFKRFLFKMNNNNIEAVQIFEMDLKSKIITKRDGNNNAPPKIRKYNEAPDREYQYKFNHEDVIDTYSIATEKEYYAEREDNKPDLNRCVSRCGCCPLDSPQRATKMDVLGRSRKKIIKMDDLENYPKAASNKLNTKHIETEGAVQRRVRTTSTFSKSLNSVDSYPNVVIQPNVVDFGTISVGYVYRFTASITNHGNNQARIKVDIKNDDDGVYIKPYYRAGGIAPGITIMLEIELYSVDFVGKYTNELKIKTQKHIFDVNIKANVVESDFNLVDSNRTNKKSRITCLGKKDASRYSRTC